MKARSPHSSNSRRKIRQPEISCREAVVCGNRWRLPGQGKRGGARVIHYFRDEEFPLVLIDIYAKSERADLSPADLDRIGKLVAELKQGKRRR